MSKLIKKVRGKLLEWGESYHFIDDAQEITDGLDAILAPLAAELAAARKPCNSEADSRVKMSKVSAQETSDV
jgi:hypothetical protein